MTPTPDLTSYRVCVRVILKTAWDRLLSSFMLVAATVRDLLPSDIKDSISQKEISHRHSSPHPGVSMETLLPYRMRYKLHYLVNNVWSFHLAFAMNTKTHRVQQLTQSLKTQRLFSVSTDQRGKRQLKIGKIQNRDAQCAVSRMTIVLQMGTKSLRHQHPLWAPIHVPAAPLPRQLPATDLDKAEDGPSA